ncbi:reverse transcriptase [Gossypium australe]|uniref:Reverse transcriptase n=1 Tax=Gossypium australe TaxID=47621 RepID=A0A5B6X189_9ROSI|nr:reverse transcriptase [Gossypium australe]
MQEGDKAVISRVLEVRSSNNLERYLGLPKWWDRMKQQIDRWSVRQLSQGGKNVFIKAILQAIPTYTMACFLIPKSLCDELEGIEIKKGIHWCT